MLINEQKIEVELQIFSRYKISLFTYANTNTEMKLKMVM